jgi:hypothetical protein
MIASGGMIVGGWEYVWGAYGITWAVLGGYAFSLWWRGRSHRSEAP